MEIRRAALHAAVVASFFLLASCGGGGGGGSGCDSIGGNYQGTANDNVLGSGSFAVSVVQSGCSISGSAQSCFQSTGCGGGNISGTVSSSSFSVTIFNGGSC